MSKRRQIHGAAVRAKVAIAAVRERKTVCILASQQGIHTSQVYQWKRRLVDAAPELFETRRSVRDEEEYRERETEFLQEIGRLKTEIEWLKKNLPSTISQCREIDDVNDQGTGI